MADVTLRLTLKYPDLVFSPPRPFCLVCGDDARERLRVRFDEAEYLVTPSKKLEFNAPLCARHKTRARRLKAAGLALLAGALSQGLMILAFPGQMFLLGTTGLFFAYIGFRARHRGIRGGLSGRAALELPDRLTLTGAATEGRHPEPPRLEESRQPPPGEPYPFRPAEAYSRAEALAALPSGDAPGELAGGRFVVLKDGVLAFLDSSDLRFETAELVEWWPAEAIRVSEERPTWLPSQLRDGTTRARRGVALFIRWDHDPYVYAGKAELSSWPVGQDEPRCARFTMNLPVRPPAHWKALKLSDPLEVELGKIRSDIDSTGLSEVLLRKVAKGDAAAWSEVMETLVDGDTDFGALKIVAPFLLNVLKELSVPFAEDILWLFAAAPEDGTWGAKAAAAKGVEIYLTFLHHPQPNVRRAAAFALRSCDRPSFTESVRSRVRDEKDEGVQAALLLVLRTPGASEDLPLFLELLRTSTSPRVKTVAALLAVESSPASLPADAAKHLRAQAKDWDEFESWWHALDVGGTMPLDPEEILRNHGLLWADDDGDLGDLLNTLAGIPKEALVRCLIAAAEVEIYERALTAEQVGAAEVALDAARAWLKNPTSGVLENKARSAGAEAAGLLAGAAASACARIRDLAAKTCLDALSGLPAELRRFAFRRIRETLHR